MLKLPEQASTELQNHTILIEEMRQQIRELSGSLTEVGEIVTGVVTTPVVETGQIDNLLRNSKLRHSWDTWANPLPGDIGTDSGLLPIGGTTGQVLAKASNNDFDVEWATVSGGSGDLDGGAPSLIASRQLIGASANGGTIAERFA